jgi:hypothetical protein
MKKLFLLSISAFVFSVMPLISKEKQTWNDQPHKYEVRIGWGMPSDVFSDAYYSDPGYSASGRLSSIYAPRRGPLYLTGGISAEFGLNFRKWFTLTFHTSFCGAWSDVYDSSSIDVIGTNRGVSFNLIPQARFNWVKRPAFKMYTTIGYGMSVVAYGGHTVIQEAFQFVPVGMAAGKDVFFFVEVGGGTQNNFLGYNLGLGYRF